MANMLFAGIPLEGSGARQLDADLYGAENQNVDQENLSATGNLNMGNVIRYDEHTQRHMSGGTRGDEAANASAGTLSGAPGYLPDAEPEPRPLTYGGGEAGPSQAAPVAASHELAGAQRAQQIAPASAAPDAALAANAAAPGTTASGSETTSSTSHTSGGGDTITNSYNTYNSTVTNNINSYTENNYTYNNSSTIIGGDQYINLGTIINTIGGGGGGGGGDSITIIQTINNVTTTTITHVTDIIGDGVTQIINIINVSELGDSIIEPVVTVIGDTLTQVANLLGDVDLGDVVNQITGTTETLLTEITTLLGGDEGVLTAITNTVETALTQLLEALNGNDGDLLSSVTAIVGDTLETVSGVITQLGGEDLLGDVVNTVNNTLTQLGDTLGSVVSPAGPVTDIVTTVGDTLGDITTILGGGAGGPADIIQQVASIVEDGLTDLGGTLTATLEPVIAGAQDTLGGIVPPLLEGAHNTVQGILEPLQPALDTAGDTLGSVAAPLTDALAGLNGGHPLLDANTALLGDAFPAADNFALINADANILSLADHTPNATGDGLLDVDTSLLSLPGTPGAADGLSVTLNLNRLTEPLFGNSDLPVPAIDIPLPTATAISPSLPGLAETVMQAGDTLHESLGGALDPAATLAALSAAPSLIAAVDAGVLFTGAGATAGHSDAPAPAAPIAELHVGNLLHGLLGGHH